MRLASSGAKPCRSLALIYRRDAVTSEQVGKCRFLLPVNQSCHEKLERLWISDLDPDFLAELADRTRLGRLPRLAVTTPHVPLPRLLDRGDIISLLEQGRAR